jgi:AcrR family transcriptional regulator
MPRPRFTRAAPEMQEALLAAGAREFAAHGYDGASLNGILLAAGLSKGAFYYYFDDKADLAAAVLERELRNYDAGDLHAVNSAAGFWTELHRFSAQSLAQLRLAPQRGELLTRLGAAIAREPALMERCGPLIARAREQGGAFWRRGQEIGAVRTDLSIDALLAVAQASKTALAGALLPADRGATPDEIEAFTRVYLDLLRRISEPREEATP